MRILLAEDEKALSKAIVKIFERNNYSADAVYKGEDAVSYIESGNYDVAVLDIMMPKMDGLTALKKIRADGYNIPVLMLTAKSEIEDRVAGLDSGANDYLPKPFDTRELLARIRALTRTKTETDTKIRLGKEHIYKTSFSKYGTAFGLEYKKRSTLLCLKRYLTTEQFAQSLSLSR